MNEEMGLSQSQVTAIQRRLLEWGKVHFRPFPWRQTEDPYHILVAEILLHRTRVHQMKPVYEAFIERFPDISALARSGREEIHHALYSLGLRWRVDSFFEMIQVIQNRFEGKIPEKREDLLSLPGVSAYIAGAVRCFAWNQPEVLMDTNTVRITGRLLGWEVKDSSRRSVRFRQALETFLDREHPRDFNYALLDLAHLVCLKRQPPLCGECPLKIWCHHAEKGEKDS